MWPVILGSRSVADASTPIKIMNITAPSLAGTSWGAVRFRGHLLQTSPHNHHTTRPFSSMDVLHIDLPCPRRIALGSVTGKCPEMLVREGLFLGRFCLFIFSCKDLHLSRYLTSELES